MRGKEKKDLLLAGSLICVIFVFVGYPLAKLLLYSLGLKKQECTLTAVNYIQAFGDIHTLVALKNTFYVSVGVTFFSLLTGGALAWLLVRTDVPYKRAIKQLIFITFTIPSYILALAWIELLGRNGFMNRVLFIEWKLMEQPLNLYSLEGVIFILVMHSYPLVFMAVEAVLRQNDRAMEMAARMAGANRVQTLRTITLPLILPTVLSIGLMIFQHTMADFGVPAIIALPTGHYVLTTRIYSALNSMDLAMATAMSVILLIFSGSVFYLYHISFRRKRFIYICSSSQPAECISLGRFKNLAAVGIMLFLLVTTLLPIATLTASSFLKCWGLDLNPDNMTFHNYTAIFSENTIALRAIGNSISFGIFTATVATALGVAISYLSVKTKVKGRGILELLATFPLAVPGTVIAIAFTLAWINEPFKLYGTPWIILAAYFAVCLPFGVRNINGCLQGIDPVLEDAARVAGASKGKAFRDIIFPAIVPGIRIGWITSFLRVLREIPISIMLYSAGSETIGVLLYRMRSGTGGLETVSAIAVIVIILTVLGNVCIQKIGRSRMEGLNDSHRNM